MPTPPCPLRLIGAPTDVGASVRGASMGPEALRVAGLAEALRRLGHSVEDGGNLQGPTNPSEPPAAHGCRHLAEVLAWNQQAFDAVDLALRERRLPLLLGGDHSLSIGSIAAVARHCAATGKPLRVLWLDAHADCNTPATSPSGNLHGMPVACLCGLGPEALTRLAALPDGRPALQPAQLRQVGLRSVDPAEKRLVHHLGLEVFDMRCVDELGMRAVMAQALRGVDAHTHLHLSLDLDFLDPSIAPGVGTPVCGGPSYREAQRCMEWIADTGALGSLDLVELNPARDRHNQTAELAVDLVESLFGKSTLVRPRPDGR